MGCLSKGIQLKLENQKKPRVTGGYLKRGVNDVQMRYADSIARHAATHGGLPVRTISTDF